MSRISHTLKSQTNFIKTSQYYNIMINETNQTVQVVLGHTLPLTATPTFDIYIITLVVSLFMTLTHKYMSDQIAIKALRAEMKVLQKKMRKVMSKDPKKAQMLQKEIMKKNLENMTKKSKDKHPV